MSLKYRKAINLLEGAGGLEGRVSEMLRFGTSTKLVKALGLAGGW